MKNNESEVLEFAFNGVILFIKALIKGVKIKEMTAKDMEKLVIFHKQMDGIVKDVEKKNMCGDKVEVVKSLVGELQEVISENMIQIKTNKKCFNIKSKHKA
ncbi:hypothetical protein I9Y31_001255 [Clostridium perfringens]|nr:hypothetical protein [Clostridium perfringens]